MSRLDDGHTEVMCKALLSALMANFWLRVAGDRTVRLWCINKEGVGWEKISGEWQRQLSPQRAEAGRCPICGEGIFFGTVGEVENFAESINDFWRARYDKSRRQIVQNVLYLH